MKKKITFIALTLIFKLGMTQELNKDYFETVKTFVNCFKNNDIDKLKTLVAYPLKRAYPLSDIENEVEFEKRYKEIFDDSFRHKITLSNIGKDWAAVGWRGIMYNNGDLWLDYNGRLIALNYQSNIDINKRIELIEKDKTSIHESLKDFEAPIIIIKTKKFNIRIDKQYNAKYRYASWSIDSKMSEKPDLLINNGNWIPEGSLGNHRYEFINGNYRYNCIINVLGGDEIPPVELVVYLDDKEILMEQGQIIRK